MKIIPFHHWLLFTRGIPFPRVKGRSNLVELMRNDADPLDDAEAQMLWAEYMDWHCSLAPIKRPETFKTWARALREFDNEHERAFVQDMDKYFPPVFQPDFIVDYLSGMGALDEAIDAFERLWIKYKTRD